MITNEKLMQIAQEACQNSYSPYSKFPVGAAVLYSNGNVYKGVNVENSSFGLTLCAERNALSTAIATGEKSELEAIAIFSPKEKMCAPCGACRQWIWEFSNNRPVKVILEAKEGGLFVATINDLLPFGFLIETTEN